MLPEKKQIGPFLKWAGGKSGLVSQFRATLPKTLEGRGYVEPFVGSGAVFFYVIQNLKPKSCTLLDINPELINAWQQIQRNVEGVIMLLKKHKARHNAPHIGDKARKEYYNLVRASTPKTKAARAARFIYLNKTCFNGLHRVNSLGQFNVPMGAYKEPAIFDAGHLRHVSRLLKDVAIEVCPFSECHRFVNSGDFIYLDPPYAPLSKTSNFTAYAKDRFLEEEQAELRDFLKALGDRAEWMLSNSTAPLIKKLYASRSFYKRRVLARRAINSNAQARGRVGELLITNYKAA